MAGCSMFIDLSTARTQYNKTRGELFANKGRVDSVPALAMISHREATQELATARTQQERESGGELAAAAADAGSQDEAKLLEALQPLYAEAEWLLRIPLTSIDAMQTATDRVTAALAFETSLTAMAKEKAVLKGKIFQSLLEDLRAGEESHAQVDLSARGESGGAEALGISRTEWVAMQAQADMLRKLVRIKIADDNDIKAARCALETCKDFFDNLQKLALLRGATPFECMQTL